MFEIEKRLKKINDEKVTTFARKVTGPGTSMEVEAGTTGYKGTPCRSAGGRTYLSIECRRGDFHFDTITAEDGTKIGVEIACCGDAGLEAIMKALTFAYHAIDDQCYEIED